MLRLLVATFAAAAALLPATTRADAFWDHFGDGKAELAGYALTQPRYGAPRDGVAVLIFVTEDFSDALRVKADPGRHPKADVYPVLKLNLVRRFQTGIYDYSLMSSTFVRTEPGLPLVKTSFSAQEWCGHVYQQWLRRGARLEGALHSYFDGEADQTPSLDVPPNGVLEEALPILVRELKGPWLAPGETRVLPLLPSLARARLQHQVPAWTEAKVTRSKEARPEKTALGTLAAYTYTVEERGGDTTTYLVEASWPHRLLAWRKRSGEEARILGAKRLRYWELQGKDGEAQLQALGLKPARYR